MNIDPHKLHELLNYCIDFAKAMLSDSGDFYPFGATIDSSGQLKAVGGYDGKERPAPQDIYRLLGESFLSGAREGELSAVALAANVNIPPDFNPPVPDGLRVHLECVGFSRFIYVPYAIERKGLFRKSIEATFYEPIPVEVGATFFPQA